LAAGATDVVELSASQPKHNVKVKAKAKAPPPVEKGKPPPAPSPAAAITRMLPKWHTAEDRIYPGGGRMSAQDVHNTIAEVAPTLNAGEEVKRESKMGGMQPRQRAMAAVKARIKEKARRQHVRNTDLKQRTALARSKFKHCQVRLEKCKKKNKENHVHRDLKEARSMSIDTTDTKTTAVDDDMKRRGEQPPAARERSHPAHIPFKRTAKERYAYEQSLKLRFNQDKHHPSNDYPSTITKGARVQRKQAQKTTTEEIRHNAAAIPRADHKTRRANAELKYAQDQMRAAEETRKKKKKKKKSKKNKQKKSKKNSKMKTDPPKPTSVLLRDFHAASTDLFVCVDHEQKCAREARRKANASKLPTAVKSALNAKPKAWTASKSSKAVDSDFNTHTAPRGTHS